MLTPEQENELRAAVNLPQKSPAVEYAVPTKSRTNDEDTMDQLFKSAGVDTETLDAEMRSQASVAHKQRITELHAQADALETERMIGQAGTVALDAAAGVSLGFRDIARNTYNGLVTLSNAAEDFAANKGIGSGDIISESNKWQDEFGQQVGSELDTTGQVTRAVTNFATPLLATMATGGTFAVGMGVNAAYNFLVVDPDQARLSDHLKDTGLREVPIVTDVLDFLRHKPDDSELTSRFKNLIEGAGIDSAVGLMLLGASRAYSGIKNLRKPKIVEVASQEVDKLKTPAAPVENVPTAIDTPANQLSIEEQGKILQQEFNPPDQMQLEKILPINEYLKNPVRPGTDGVLKEIPAFTVEPRKFGDVTLEYDPSNFSVFASDAKGNYIGQVALNFELQDGKHVLASGSTYIEPAHRQKDVARQMYQYIKDNIGEIKPSMSQSPAGKAFTAGRIAKDQELAKVLQKDTEIAYQELAAKKAAAPEIGSPEEVAQLDLFEKQWATIGLDQPSVYTKPDTGETLLRLANDEILDYADKLIKQGKGEFFRVPMSDAETKAAADLMKNDPNIIKKIITADPNTTVLTDKETMVLGYLVGQKEASLGEAISFAVANINDDAALIKFGRELENYSRYADLQSGANSAKGATLRSIKILGQLANAGDKEALAMLGAQGRAKYAQGLIDQYGGREAIKSNVRNLEFIKELSKVNKMPNADFGVRMNEVIQLSKWNKIENAIIKVALNGMLSSPMTGAKALITNAATTFKTGIDNYISVGVGKALGTQDARTLVEANAHMEGMLTGYLESVEPAMNVVKTGVVTKNVRMDLAESAGKIFSQEDAMFKAGGAWASKYGAMADKVITTPTRVLMGIDTYWQRVNYMGVVNSEAIRSGLGRGLQGAELESYIQAFKAKPPAGVVFKADQVAAANTMAKDLTGFAESMDNVITDSGKYLPFNRVILPFFKTNMNLIEYTVKNSPFAPMLSQDFKMAMARGGRDRDEALARVISGSAAIAGFTYLAHKGLVTGRNTDNPEIERALKDNKTVAPETSIKVGDTWVSIQGLEPLSTMVDMAVLFNKSAGYVSEQEYMEAATAMLIMANEVATPEQLTDSLSGLLNVIKGKQGAQEYLATIPSRFTPFGALMTDVRQTTDTTTRSTRFKDFYDTVKARWANQVPYLSKTLPAERNTWGEKLLIPDGIGIDAISPLATTSDDGMALKRALTNMDDYYEMNKDVTAGLYKFDIRMPAKIMKNPFANVQYQLTPQEYSAYMVYRSGIDAVTGEKLMNRTLKEAVSSVVKKYGAETRRPQDYDPKVYAAMVGELSQIFVQYTNVADKLILQFGDVGPKLKEQADKYRSFEELKNVTQ